MSVVRVKAVKWIKERKIACQCRLAMHLEILNFAAVAWTGTAQVCLLHVLFIVVV